MKKELKELIEKELSDFRGRKAYTMKDWRLTLREKSITPIEVVQDMWDKLLEVKCISKLSEHYGLNHTNIRKIFKYYPQFNVAELLSSFEDEKYLEKTKLRQQHYDTELISYSEWNNKYNVKSSSLFYTYRRVLNTYRETKERVEKNLADSE